MNNRDNSWRKDLAYAVILYIIVAVFLYALKTYDVGLSSALISIIFGVGAVSSTLLFFLECFHIFNRLNTSTLDSKDIIDDFCADMKSKLDEFDTSAVKSTLSKFGENANKAISEICHSINDDVMHPNSDFVNDENADFTQSNESGASKSSEFDMLESYIKRFDTTDKCKLEPFTALNEKREKQCNRVTDLYENILIFLEENFTADNLPYDTYKTAVDAVIKVFARNLRVIYRCVSVFDFASYNSKETADDVSDETALFYLKRVTDAIDSNAAILTKLETLQRELVDFDVIDTTSLDRLDILTSELKEYAKVGD
jgi:hypothetical protein